MWSRRLAVLIAVFVIAVPLVAQTTRPMDERLRSDLTRLTAILTDLNTHPNLGDAVVKAAARESLMLANRVNARVKGDARATSREMRKHIQLFQTEAAAGDMTEARQHAAEALPIAARLMNTLMR